VWRVRDRDSRCTPTRDTDEDELSCLR
jgi:hypothetical protein